MDLKQSKFVNLFFVGKKKQKKQGSIRVIQPFPLNSKLVLIHFKQKGITRFILFKLCFYFGLFFLGHKQRHKRHKLRRKPADGVTTASIVVPVVGSSFLNELESLSAGLSQEALLTAESSSFSSARPSNDSSGDSGPHRRSKRFLSYPRFVEVMLVADNKMVEHHGSNLQHYILTLMSIVSSLSLCHETEQMRCLYLVYYSLQSFRGIMTDDSCLFCKLGVCVCFSTHSSTRANC